MRIPPDSTGKKMRALKETVDAQEVHSETVVLLGWDGTQLVKLQATAEGKLRVVIP